MYADTLSMYPLGSMCFVKLFGLEEQVFVTKYLESTLIWLEPLVPMGFAVVYQKAYKHFLGVPFARRVEFLNLAGFQ